MFSSKANGMRGRWRGGIIWNLGAAERASRGVAGDATEESLADCHF